MDLNGTTVLLTGATGGIGRALAEALAGEGSRLILSSRRGDELERMAAELPGDGHGHLVADLADPGAALALADSALALGPIDILVSNAGLPASGRLSDLDPEHISRAVRVNLESSILLAQALLPGMLERDRGHLLFMSSLAGKVAPTYGSVYAATKFGLRGFARGLREDLRGTAVGCSVVMPGFVSDAGMYADAAVQLTKGFGTSTPQHVCDAVIGAIVHDRGAVEVAPPIARALTGIAAAFPEIAGRAIHRSGQSRVGERMADAQREKR